MKELLDFEEEEQDNNYLKKSTQFLYFSILTFVILFIYRLFNIILRLFEGGKTYVIIESICLIAIPIFSGLGLFMAIKSTMHPKNGVADEKINIVLIPNTLILILSLRAVLRYFNVF